MNKIRSSLRFIFVLMALACPVAEGQTQSTEIVEEGYDAERGWSLRVKLPAELPAGDAPLVAITDAGGEHLFRLRTDKALLIADIWTVIPGQQWIDSAKEKGLHEHVAKMIEGRMEQTVPHELLDRSRTRELLMVVTPLNIDVYLDGVVVDQEWPLGLRAFKAPRRLTMAQGIEAEYSSATPKAKEVAARYGSPAAARAAWENFFGETGGVPPHYCPQGRGLNVRDCMTLYHDGRFHVFFNMNRRPDANRIPKWVTWADSWEHISSADLIHWEEHPSTVEITEPWEGAMWTGSVIHNGSEFLAFDKPWCFLDMEGVKSGVRIHRSQDGIHFTKDLRTLPGVIMGDPEVFRMSDGRWGMITRGNDPSIKNGPPHWPTRGFAFFTSPDLENWTRAEEHPFEFAPTNSDCPHYFEWGGRSWFLASRTARTAPAFEGPWTDIPRNSLGVPKTAPWKNGRRLIVSQMNGTAVFHELVLLPGNRLGDKFIPEMTPLRGDVLALEPRALSGKVDAAGKRALVAGKDGAAVAAIDGVPQMARIRMTIRPEGEGGRFGLVLRGKGDFTDGIMFLFDTVKKAVSTGPVTSPGEHRARRTIEQVDGLNGPIALDILLGSYGLIDVEINQQHCITLHGSMDPSFDRLLLFADGGDVVFEDIEVRPWEPVATVKRHHDFE